MRVSRLLMATGILGALLPSGPISASGVPAANTPAACSWARVDAPIPIHQGERPSFLASVTSPNVDDAWTVPPGFLNRMAHWNGRKWNPIDLTNPPALVSAASSNDVWGGAPVSHWDSSLWSTPPVAPTGPLIPSARPGSTWFASDRQTGDRVYLWNGATFTTFHVPVPASTYYVSGVAGFGPGDAWVVGYTPDGTIFTDHWDGASWHSVSAPAPATTGFINVTAVAGVASNDMWLAGANFGGTNGAEPIFEHWNGAAWSIVAAPKMVPETLSAVGSGDVWAGGAGPSGPRVLHWDGATWTASDPPALPSGQGNILSVSAAPGGDVWAAGTDQNSESFGNELLYHRTCFPPPAPVVAAARGADGAIWAHSDPVGGWHSLGGQTIAAPAVVTRKPTSTDPHLYIATGTDHDLWVRSDGHPGWQALGSSPVYCLDNPSATERTGLGGTTLVVACEGSDHALWYATMPDSGTGLPANPQWVRLGGALISGPAVATVNGVITFFALGTDSRVWMATPGSGFAAQPWRCQGHPAAATSSTGSTYFACRGPDGALWHARSLGSGWDSATSAGGQIVDGPGIVTSSSDATFYGEGSGGALWEETFSGGYGTGLANDGGLINHGVGASG